ncbi:MAG TPA: hypothetical protein VEZ89_12360 [Rubrivivax sp.]|nr:hypothetical protein [Rubrivivax sp.]
MNRAPATSARPADTQSEKFARPGPIPIDPQLLKLVAGGAPKGGWYVSPLSTPDTTDTSAPKGGW